MLNNLVKGNHLFDGDLVAGGVDDEEVAVDGDEQDREGGEEDAGGLDRPDQLAQDLLGITHNISQCVNIFSLSLEPSPSVGQ